MESKKRYSRPFYQKKRVNGKNTVPHRVAVEAATQIAEHKLVASVCKESFYEFVKEFWGVIIADEPVLNWHIKYLCDEMQEVVMRIIRGERKEYDLCINVPPGSSKSTLLSIMLPAWVWTIFPGFRFGGVSTTFDLQADFSRKCRTVVTSPKYQLCFPHVQLRDDQNTKKYFTTTAGGFRFSAGAEGAILGMHMHLIVIDDPVSPEQINSPAEMASVNRWIQETVSTRLVSKSVSVMVLVMQRLSVEDPTAYFLKRKKVKAIVLPAEASDLIRPPELVKFYRKGLLDPVRMDRETLREIETSTMTSAAFSSQFGQNPLPTGGGMFKADRFVIVKHLLPGDPVVRRIRFWDKAGTSGGGAWTVGVDMGLTRAGRYVVFDVIRGQWDSYSREAVILRAATMDGRGVEVGLEQEPGSGGKESAENTVRMLAGYRVRVIRVDTKKVDRADSFSVQVNGGNVILIDGDWVAKFVEEIRYFPAMRIKDQVDAASGAFNILAVPKRRCGALR